MSNRVLVRMAMYLAIFAVLDFVATTSGLFKMPQGGSLGLATIALLIASVDLKVSKALLIAMLSIFIQYVTSGPPFFVTWTQFFLDYVLAYGVYAFAVVFPIYNRKSFSWVTGVLVVNLIRFVSHVISGVLYFEAPLPASIIYNAWYMVPTAIVGFVIVGGILPRLRLQVSSK